MKVWIIKENDGVIRVADTTVTEYYYCRNFIQNLNFDDEYNEQKCLNELECSYSECKDAFKVEGIIEVQSSDLLTLF